MANLLVTILKAMIKRKLRIGTLTGAERFMLSQMTIPDQVPVSIAAGNLEPYLVDSKYNYTSLAKSTDLQLELFGKINEKYPFDVAMVPWWLGLTLTGTAEMGVEFTITDDRVPYASKHPIGSIEDAQKIVPPSTPSGYFKAYLEMYKKGPQLFPNSFFFYVNDGPWDTAMLLRGDQHLPRDFRLYKDYVESKDEERRKKIRAYGNPDLWPAIMEKTTQIVIQNYKMAKEYGVNLLGAAMVDQFAAEPVLSMDDYIKYVLPYEQKAAKALDNKVSISYMVSSPQKLEKLMANPTLKKLGSLAFTNYIFPTTPQGVSLPEYDEIIFKMAKKYGKTYSYMIQGKFLRDSTPAELEDVVKRICQMATSMRVRVSLACGSVPPGTDLNKLNIIFSTVKKYGRY